MKTTAAAVFLAATICAPLVMSAEDAAHVTSDRISVFKVPLVCPRRRRSVVAAHRNQFF